MIIKFTIEFNVNGIECFEINKRDWRKNIWADKKQPADLSESILVNNIRGCKGFDQKNAR